MAKRYSCPLQEHVRIVQEHTLHLVKKLDYQIRETARLYKKHNFKQGDTYPQDIIKRYETMKLLKAELECMQEYVFLQWPPLKELFEQLDKVEIHAEPIQAKWEKVSDLQVSDQKVNEPGETISVQ